MIHPFQSRLLLVITGFFLMGCASSAPVKDVEVAQMQAQDPVHADPLKIHLNRVHFENVPLGAALRSLSQAINAQEGGLKFLWGAEVVHCSDGSVIPQKQVHLRMNSVTLGQVLDALCTQTGRKYKLGPTGYYFTPVH